jgi:hypothetical protein
MSTTNTGGRQIEPTEWNQERSLAPAVRGIERLTVIITERNAAGEATREVEVQRIFGDGAERQTTVRAVGYNTTTSEAHPLMALPTAEARGYIRQADERKMLEPAAAVAQEHINISPIEAYARAAIVQLADAAHKGYEQYAGHWDGEKWQLGRIRRRVNTKSGVAFEPDDVVLWCDERDQDKRCLTVYSVRNAVDTAVDPRNIRPWGGS